MAVACVSLFVALGGVGYAATAIGSGQIADNSVRSKDIHDNGVRGRDVRRNTLTGADIKEPTLGEVPSAASAENAGIADKAMDAEQLDGIDSTGFMAKKTRIFEERVASAVSDFPDGAAVATLSNLPAGAYLVTARLDYDNDGGAPAGGENETCALGVPGPNDVAEVNLAAQGDPGQQQIVNLQKMVIATSPFAASVGCSSDGDDDVDHVSVVAVTVD